MPKEVNGITKYNVVERVCTVSDLYHVTQPCYQPIPLELLVLVNFTNPPLKNLRSGVGHNRPHCFGQRERTSEGHGVYPFTLRHDGRLGGTSILYAESSESRDEWKEALQNAVRIRMTSQDSDKVL